MAKKGTTKEKKVSEKKLRTPRVKKEAAASGTGALIDRGHYKYEQYDVKTASGKRNSIDNGDRIAQAMRGLDVDSVIKLVSEYGGKVNPNWKNLNAGLVRMAAGNVLRGLVRKGTTVNIEGTKIATI